MEKNDWQSLAVSREIIFNNKGIIEKEKTFLDKKLRWEYSYQYRNNKAIRTEYDYEDKSDISEELFTISKPYFKVSSIESKKLQSGKIFYDREYEWEDNVIIKEIGTARDTNYVNNITEYTYSKDGMIELRKEIVLHKDKPNEQTDWKYVNYELDEYGNWISRIKVNPFNSTLGTKEQRIIIYF